MNSSRPIAYNAWYGLLTQGVDKFFPVVIVLYLARVLAPEQFGLYSFLLAYLAFFQIVAEQSLDTVLIRMISQQPERRAVLFQTALGLRVLLAVLAAVSAVALVAPVSSGTAPIGLTLVASLGLITAMGGIYRAYFRAVLNIRAVLIIAAVRSLLLVVSIVVAMTLWPGLMAVFGATVAANLLAFAAVAWAVRAEVRPRPKLAREEWRQLLSGLWPIAANAFAITASLRAGQVILMSLRGPVDVGLLAAASRVIEAFTALPEALMIAVYPVMAGLHGNDGERLIRTARESTRYLVAATGFPVVVCVVAGDDVLRILFGGAFAEAGRALALLSVMAILSATGTVLLNLLIAVQQERILYRNTIVFAVLNVVISFPLVARFGYEGAAVAMVATSAGSQVALAFVPAIGERVRACLGAAVRPCLAAVGALLLAQVGEIGAGPRIMMAMAAYMVLLFATGGVEIGILRAIHGTSNRA